MRKITLFIASLFMTIAAMAQLTSYQQFVNGKIYYFETLRGVLGATADNANLVSSARTNFTADKSNTYCQWTVYKSNNGKYYLYNIGKGMFMGATTANNGSIPFTEKPYNDALAFKATAKSDYPIMFTCNTNTGVVNHSKDYGTGLVYWKDGWDKTSDEGSCHKITEIGTLDNNILANIADLVAVAENKVSCNISYKVEVEGWTSANQNTHFGSITLTSAGVKKSVALNKENFVEKNITLDVSENISLEMSRKYRGYDFVGFYIDGVDLGKTPKLTDAQQNKLYNGVTLVAKFKTDGTGDVTLFYDDAPKSYRIPAIATTGTGRIIAISDYRHNLDDIGRDNHGTGTKRIDLVARTSDDNGVTWNDIMTIAAGDNTKTGSYERAFGDAAVAAVGENIVVMAAAGDVLFPNGTTSNPNRMARVFSSDNGVTWTIEEMTTKMYSQSTSLIPSGGSAFFGSGKLAVDYDYNGTGNARIYGALLVRIGTNSYNNFAIYSDDLGKNWNILGGSQTPVAAGDEPKVEILPNGQILLSARRIGGRVFNVFTYTNKATSAGTWGSAVDGCDNGGSNGTNGEIFCIDALKIDKTPVKLLLQSQPKGGSGQYDRKDVTIWYKEVAANVTYTSAEIANNWKEGKQLSNDLSSYSTMDLQKDGKIAFFFEEAPCYDDNYTKGYSMVYLPLTVEEITNNNYYSVNTEIPDYVTVDVVLTDANGNEFHEEVAAAPAASTIEEALTTKYPYITLGTSGKLVNNAGGYVYTNTVTLPFTVSNKANTVWHNIYWPANTNENAYPVYLSASSENDQYVPKVTEKFVYGNSSYNTLNNNDKISWAVYNVDNSFSFIFKNKLTDKYIQATSVSDGNAQNVKYVDEADATVFTLLKKTGTYNGDYSLVADVDGKTGYLCSTSATGYHYATHYSGNKHQGAWVKFVETDYEGIIAQINDLLATVGMYTLASGKGELYNTINNAMVSCGNIKLNALNDYLAQAATLFEGATFNVPSESNKYYRIAYDYGNNVGKLYMQGVASTVKGVEFAEKNDAASIWYYDGALMSYSAGLYIKEHGNYRGLQAIGTEKQNVTFSVSSRNSGKCCINIGSFLHANTNNVKYYSDHCTSNGCAQHDFIVTAVTSLPVKISAIGYATLYAPVALEIPSGVTAYAVAVDGKWAKLTEITGVIPAETGVVLSGAPDTYYFAITTAAGDVASDLVGSVAATKVAEDAYVLGVVDGEVGFYVSEKNQDNGNSFINYSHKAYLPKLAGAAVSFYGFHFDGDDNTTVIENVEVKDAEEVVFDLAGRKVREITVPGIYIVNGKKIIR